MTDWTPKRCLTGVGLGKSDFNVRDELNAQLLKASEERDPRKTGVFHPSSFGKNCRRVIWYERTGHHGIKKQYYPEDLFMFAQGHALHDIVQGAFDNIPDFISEVPVVNESLGIYGHCDGLFYEQQWLLEIKTIGDASYKALLRPLAAHILQGHCYMYCLDVPRIQFLYINRNTLQTRMFRVKFDPSIWEQVLEVITYVDDHVAAGTEPIREENSYHCKRCKFVADCNPDVLKK